YYGVQPDLTALGKALGGGYPIGAVVGRADVMDLVREDRLGAGRYGLWGAGMDVVREVRRGESRYVGWASSLGGTPVSTAAGHAALGELRRPGTYARLFALGETLREGLRRVLAEAGIPAHVQGDGP